MTLCRFAGAALLVAAVVGLRRSGASGPSSGRRSGPSSGRQSERSSRRRSGPGAADGPDEGLAFVLEVWAALLAAGAPMGPAIASAAVCSGDRVSSQLLLVSEGLAAGLSSAEAWAGVVTPVALRQAGQACVRTERDGTSLIPVLSRLAADARAASASRGLIAARRAGVLAVLPLGLCTLPAYVALSVVPAVIGLIQQAR